MRYERALPAEAEIFVPLRGISPNMLILKLNAEALIPNIGLSHAMHQFVAQFSYTSANFGLGFHGSEALW